jgi:dihydrofolate reductase
MRKIIESTLVSLDGVFGDPHIWATQYFDQKAEEYALELLSAADAMLMGRHTYEFFAGRFPIKPAITELGSTTFVNMSFPIP